MFDYVYRHSTKKEKQVEKNDLLFFFCDDYGEHFPLLQSKRGAQVFASNSLRSNYSSRCSHYSQNKFGILLSKNLAKVNALAFKHIPPTATITCYKPNYMFHIVRDSLSRSVIVHIFSQNKPALCLLISLFLCGILFLIVDIN